MFKIYRAFLVFIIFAIPSSSFLLIVHLKAEGQALTGLYNTSQIPNNSDYIKSEAFTNYSTNDPYGIAFGFTIFKKVNGNYQEIGKAKGNTQPAYFKTLNGIVVSSRYQNEGSPSCSSYTCDQFHFTYFKDNGEIIRYYDYGGFNHDLAYYCKRGPTQIAVLRDTIYAFCPRYEWEPKLFVINPNVNNREDNSYAAKYYSDLTFLFNGYFSEGDIMYDDKNNIYIFASQIYKINNFGNKINLQPFIIPESFLNRKLLSYNESTNTFYLKNSAGYYSLKDGIYTPISLAVNSSKLDFTTRNNILQSFIGDSNSNTFQFSYLDSSWNPTAYSSVLSDKTNLNYSTIVDGDYINLFYSETTSNEIRYQYSNSSNQWSNPVATGMYTNTSFVSANHLGTYNLFYIGLDGNVHSRYYNGNKWINDKIANITSGAKQLQVLVDGEYINLFYLDANNEVNYVYTRDGNWSYPTKLTGLTTTKKFFIVNHQGAYNAFYVDIDNSLKRIWYNGKNWVDKQVIAGETDVKEVSGFVEKDYINLAFIRNSDSVPRYRYTNNGQWSGPTEIR
jgi:hypothetical protein